MIVKPGLEDLIDRLVSKEDQGDGMAQAWTVVNGSKAYLLFDPRFLTHGTIYHEVDHMVHRIMRAIGIAESSDSEEAYTYLGDWITDWVYKVLKGEVDIL